MSNLIKFVYEDHDISFDVQNGARYWNAQSMADACGSTKQVRRWIKLDSTQEYIQALQEFHKSDDNQNDITTEPSGKNLPLLSKPYWTYVGGEADKVGTWIHEELVTAFARWLSPKFSVWCDQKIRELIEQGFVLSNKLSTKQIYKLEAKLEHQIKANRVLRLGQRKSCSEARAHQIFSHAYLLVSRQNLTAEYSYKNRKFDFYEQRTGHIIITELKADAMSWEAVETELLGQKSYYHLALHISKTDRLQRKVRIKFLAPSFRDVDVLGANLKLYKTDSLEFSLCEWDAEVRALRDKHNVKYGNSKQTTREFDKIRNELAEITEAREVII